MSGAPGGVGIVERRNIRWGEYGVCQECDRGVYVGTGEEGALKG